MTAHDPALVDRIAVIICEAGAFDNMAWDDVSEHWQGNYRAKAIAVLDELGLTAETIKLPVFVDDEPPRMVTHGFNEEVRARHLEFIPHTRLRTDLHGGECPDCTAEPGVHDRRHAEYFAAAEARDE